jgi:hypothetical protein
MRATDALSVFSFLAQEKEMLFASTTLVRSATFEKADRYVQPWAKLTTGLLSSYF